MGDRAHIAGLDGDLAALAARVWLMEVVVAGANYFLLMNLVWEPAFGDLAAHRIGMATRMACILLFAWGLVVHAPRATSRQLWAVGVMWLLMTLAFEWGGSLMIGRPVSEILVGWHVERGYMWPYVLLTYLTAPALAGAVVRRRGSPPESGVSQRPGHSTHRVSGR